MSTQQSGQADLKKLLNFGRNPDYPDTQWSTLGKHATVATIDPDADFVRQKLEEEATESSESTSESVINVEGYLSGL